MAAEGDDVAPEQHQPAQSERPARQQQTVGPAGPGAHEQRQPGGSDETQQHRRRPREHQPTAVAVDPADGAIGVGQHEAPAASRGDQAVTDAPGQRSPPATADRGERVDGQLGEHAVGAEVGDDAHDLIGRQAPADAGELTDERGNGPRPIHALGQGQLVGMETDVGRAWPVR